MKRQQTFFQTVCALAIPVALQSMLQSSFGMVDQIMIGRLGEVSVAGVGLAGKFTSIYLVIVSAVAAVAGIMILGGGVLRSGGRTTYIMAIDMAGTWCLGVPLGLLSAFVWKMPVSYVYFLLSLEEGFRLAVSLAVFRRRSWMDRLGGSMK